MTNSILRLLADRNPRQAQDFILAFGEHRSASWTDSHKQASVRAASKGHLPHFRGQLRHQLGEASLATAAHVAKVGCIPVQTVKPGGFFMVARVGRFGLVCLSVRGRRFMPRRSATRRLLSGPNDDLDPQQKLRLADEASARGATELAYFGCMVTTPSRSDPTSPGEVVLAIPNARLTDWIEWIPLPRLFAMLQDFVPKSGEGSRPAEAKPIPDLRIPQFRLPKHDRKGSEE
jgi:hypothetical protein